MHALLFVLAALAAPAPELHTPSINLLVGDLSATGGYTPSLDGLPPEEAQRARVRGHLLFAHDVLAAIDTSGLPASLRAARAVNLERLRIYAEAGRFPSNDDHPDAMRPTFVDDAGTICAVGALFAADHGRAATERIAASYKYAFIAQIDDPELLAWQRSSGLSPVELALIQPTYPGRHRTPLPEPPRELEWLPFGLLDRMQHAEPRVTATTEVGSVDAAATVGVTLHAQLVVATLGLYATLPISLPADGSVELASSEVGVFGGSEELLRIGLVVPTGQAEPRQFVSARVGDAILDGRRIGGRFAVSKLETFNQLRKRFYEQVPNIEAAYRIDAGVDGALELATEMRESSYVVVPRFGVGFLVAPKVATVSLETAISLPYDSTDGLELRWSTGVMFEPNTGLHTEPAITLAVVRSGLGWGGTLSVELGRTLRH